MPDLVEQMYCSQQIFIPPNLPSILKKYAKAAIRTQPGDLLTWSSAYFRALASGIPPPAKDRIEYPPVDTPSGLSPGFLKVLISQVGKCETVEKDVLSERWKGICLNMDALQDLLDVGMFEDQVSWLEFIAICAGTLEPNLTRTMIQICEILTDEPEGGRAAIPVTTFLTLYKYLAKLDCGPVNTREEYEMIMKEDTETPGTIDELKPEEAEIEEVPNIDWEQAIEDEVPGNDAEDLEAEVVEAAELTESETNVEEVVDGSNENQAGEEENAVEADDNAADEDENLKFEDAPELVEDSEIEATELTTDDNAEAVPMEEETPADEVTEDGETENIQPSDDVVDENPKEEINEEAPEEVETANNETEAAEVTATEEPTEEATEESNETETLEATPADEETETGIETESKSEVVADIENSAEPGETNEDVGTTELEGNADEQADVSNTEEASNETDNNKPENTEESTEEQVEIDDKNETAEENNEADNTDGMTEEQQVDPTSDQPTEEANEVDENTEVESTEPPVEETADKTEESETTTEAAVDESPEDPTNVETVADDLPENNPADENTAEDAPEEPTDDKEETQTVQDTVETDESGYETKNDATDSSEETQPDVEPQADEAAESEPNAENDDPSEPTDNKEPPEPETTDEKASTEFETYIIDDDGTLSAAPKVEENDEEALQERDSEKTVFTDASDTGMAVWKDIKPDEDEEADNEPMLEKEVSSEDGMQVFTEIDAEKCQEEIKMWLEPQEEAQPEVAEENIFAPQIDSFTDIVEAESAPVEEDAPQEEITDAVEGATDEVDVQTTEDQNLDVEDDVVEAPSGDVEMTESTQEEQETEEIQETPSQTRKDEIEILVRKNSDLIFPTPTSSDIIISTADQALNFALPSQHLNRKMSMFDIHLEVPVDETVEEVYQKHRYPKWMNIPGIGPIVPDHIMEQAEKYFLELSELQDGMVMPRNIRHFHCPPLELFEDLSINYTTRV